MGLYKQRIEETKIKDLSLKKYLEESINSHKDKSSLCIGWDYLKLNLNKELKEILLTNEYNKIFYNSENVDFILNNLNIKLDEKLKSQLSSFVYVWKDIKSELNNQEKEEKLKDDLLKKGFKQGVFLKLNDKETIEELEKRREEYYKKLDGLKVVCVMDISKIGIMGSFDKTEEIKGKFFYSKRGLMLIPKRCRTRGYFITKRFYYKELENET
jgi:hypothetical protein